MVKTKQIEGYSWLDYCSLFSNGNKRRLLNVAWDDDETGFQMLAEDMPLMGLDYDPINKGDDMIVSLGKDSLEFSHTIDAPVEMWELHNELGVITSV